MRGFMLSKAIASKITFLWEKKTFKMPMRSKFLIYDKVGSDALRDFFLEQQNTETIPTRGEYLPIICLILTPFFVQYFKIRLLPLNTLVFNAYIDSWIYICKPLVILTFIDNDPRFYTIKSRWEKTGIKTVAIQNGMRCDGLVRNDFTKFIESNSSIQLSCNILAVFNSTIGRLYAQFIDAEIVEHGSLLNNSVPPLKIAQPSKKDVVFISQFRDSLAEGILFDYERKLLPMLAKWCKLSDKHLNILGCTLGETETSEEARFYSEVLASNGYSYRFVQRFRSRQEQYRYLDKSSLIVSIDSTLGFEAIARGCKTIFFYGKTSSMGTLREKSLELDILLKWGVACNLDSSNEDQVLSSLDIIDNQDPKEWLSIKAKYANQVMSEDFGSKNLKKRIESLLACQAVKVFD